MSALRLAADEAHSWCVALDVSPDVCARLYATLSREEQKRSARLRFERDRQRFIVAHGVLRDLLGRYLGTDPAQIRFVCNAFGKPEISPEVGGRLRFNLSHSVERALIAVAADADIGVDIEYVQPSRDYTDIARHFFSTAEVKALNRLPQHGYAEAFLCCWTKREARAKASGGGIAVPLRHDAWSCYTLQPAPGYVGSLAIARSGWRLTQCQWQV